MGHIQAIEYTSVCASISHMTQGRAVFWNIIFLYAAVEHWLTTSLLFERLR